MMKSAVCAFISVFLMLWCTVPGVEADSGEVIRKVQHATVIILVYDKSGKPVGQGSGFFFNTQGRIITNFHVLGNAAMAKARTHDGREFDIASIVAEASADDLVEAVVDLPSGARYLSAAGGPAKAGDPVMVIGSPLGVEKVVSQGSVTGIQEIPKYGKCLVHSAHSFPGSSGSPVVNGDGEVVGIATAAVPGKPDLNVAVPVERLAGLSYRYRQLQRSSAPAPAQKESENAGSAFGGAFSAEPEDPAGQVQLALRYEQGRGVAKNCFEALSLYRKAAGQGSAEAEYHLGRMYRDGGCMGRNLGEACRWLRRAAERGVPEAQSLYGNLHFNGEGVPRDRITACMWTILAASNGDQEAAKILRFMSVELTETEMKTAQKRAKDYKPQK